MSTQNNTTTADPIYALGRTYREYQRLVDQAEMLAPATERMLRAAGVSPGMRILDVGSGVGDVAFLAARLVGPTGSVVGVDKDATVLDVACQRAHDLRLANVSFIQGDLLTVEPGGPFDAAIGRFVLMYTKEPRESLRAIARHVRSGGLLAFHETAFRSVKIADMQPVFAASVQLVLDVLARAGVHDNLGMSLFHEMREIGLQPEPWPIVESPMNTTAQSAGYHNLAEVVRSLLPAAQKFEIASAETVDIDTLEARLRTEHDERLVPAFLPIVGQWARKP